LGGRTRSGTNGTLRALLTEESPEKQEGQPFKTLGPHISPNAVNCTTQVQSKTDVVARIIHSFILDLDIELLSFSTLLSPIAFKPISLLSSSLYSQLFLSLFLSILHISLLFPPCNRMRFHPILLMY
jgi:hypothetical protein